ncbi:hypothetical protein [Natrialba taiwanensis]|uniref:Uncharacterized protein n=1 Tax=Natrialba taiwanensis DSM 12281 TaxID=1230458 RepID=L9ZZ60_9EURY|nr:hypothetical protein [Natrialba taiwanensis]ELY91805.1 hypothetical protein C484_09916 [Natrialba taiwanensis DSM 12281]
MRIRSRRGLILGGLVFGTAAWLHRSLRRSDISSTDEFIDERHMWAFLVRRRIDPQHVDAIREAVSKAMFEDEPSALLSLDGATTASLFLNRDPTTPELVWYVELPRSAIADWDDPEVTVSEAFPLTHDALADTDDTVERKLLVHAVNPLRPRTNVSDGVVSQHITGAGGERTVDIALVSVWFTAGLPERLADWFTDLTHRFKTGELNLGPIETWSVEMIDMENMYTETLFLERSATGYELLSYMEADEIQRVYDAYYDTWNPVARVSEIALNWALRDPSPILDYPLKTDFELLAHAITPNRPRRVPELPGHHEGTGEPRDGDNLG